MNKWKLSKKLADNLKYFTDNPEKRCYDASGCFYSGKTIGKNTKGCFVGALLPARLRLEIDEAYPSGANFSNDLFEKFPEIPKWMKDNEDVFDKFQHLHDNNLYWNDKGLSELGVERLKMYIDKYFLVEKEFKQFFV